MTVFFNGDERFKVFFNNIKSIKISKKCSADLLGNNIYVFYNKAICADLLIEDDFLIFKIRKEALFTGEWIGLLDELKEYGLKGRKNEFIICTPEYFSNLKNFRTPEEHKKLLKSAKKIKDPR